MQKSKELKKRKKNKSKKSKILKLILLLLLLIIVLTVTYFIYGTIKNGGGTAGLLSTAIGQTQEERENLEPISVLLLGSSLNLTDTIIVARYNPQTQLAYLISIPRDTYTGSNKSNATASDKINCLYQGKYPEKTLKAVNKITGLDIEYYAIIDTEALKELVDTIGGVYFDVPIDMHYTDKKQNLYIDLEAGYQLLDGEKAEQVVRFRHNSDGSTYSADYGDNDIGRMKTQRNFLKALMQQTLKLENITKIKDFVNILEKYVDTNIPLSLLTKYVPAAVEFDVDNLKTGTIEGTPEKCNGVWLFINNITKTKSYFKKLNNTIDNISTDDISKIKIEILNGSGSSYKLTNVKNKLKEEGFTISKTGSTNSTAKTSIINKSEISDTLINKIKDTINTGIVSKDSSELSEKTSVDITIILGKDYTI